MTRIHPVFGVAVLSAVFISWFIWATLPRLPTDQELRHQRVQALASSWSSEPSYDSIFVPLTPNFVSKTGPIADQTGTGLVIDVQGHYELVDAYCTACHSLDIVRQQKASRTRWESLLVWMKEEQGMGEIPKEDLDLVLDYLAENYTN